MNIAIIGGGNIGSRHLQAIARIDTQVDVYVVDPSDSARKLSEERFCEIEGHERHALNMIYSILELPQQIEIAIVATSSAIRRRIVEELVLHSKIQYMILEKFMFQTERDFDEIGKLLRSKNVIAYTDCIRRVMGGYKELKKTLDDASYIDMSVTGGNWGLGCNAIHMLDIFAYLTNDNSLSADESMLDDFIYDSKRDDYIEFCGKLNIRGKRGILSLTSYNSELVLPSIVIQTDKKLVNIVESKKRIVTLELDKPEGELGICGEFDFLPTSITTTLVVNDLIENGKCDLPTYEENAKLEVLLLNAFLRKMNKITGKDNKVCPIT